MSLPVSNAIAEALRVIGHTPDTYDVDAVYGTLISHGIHVMSADDVISRMFDDRCDFECPTCHPEDDET